MLIRAQKLKKAFAFRAVLKVWKAHELTFSVWMLEANTHLNNINSLYETSRAIVLQTALNREQWSLKWISNSELTFLSRFHIYVPRCLVIILV